MPLGDRTGPAGAGPRSGRGLGLCNGYAAPGYLNAGYGYARGAGFGRGMGYGRAGGYGRGRGFGFHAGWGYGYGYPQTAQQPTKEDEKNILESEIERLTDTLESLKKRLNELKS